MRQMMKQTDADGHHHEAPVDLTAPLQVKIYMASLVGVGEPPLPKFGENVSHKLCVFPFGIPKSNPKAALKLPLNA